MRYASERRPQYSRLDTAPAISLELGGDGVGDGLDLLLRDVVACDQHAFVKWHGWSLWLDRPENGHSQGAAKAP